MAAAFVAAEPDQRAQIERYVKRYVARALESKGERLDRFRKAADALSAEAAANGWNDELNEALLRGDFDGE